MRILVSACLLGLCTRYDGGHCLQESVLALKEKHQLVPVCPEQLGGLPTPRPPCERIFDRVVDFKGADKTLAFEQGAEQAFAIFQLSGCQAALLKARSPSCGKGPIYDGSFTGRLVKRQGLLAERLIACGIPVYTEEEIHLIPES